METHVAYPEIIPYVTELGQQQAEVFCRMFIPDPKAPAENLCIVSSKVICASCDVPEAVGKSCRDIIYEYRTRYVRAN